MTNSVDSEANWSGSTLFAKTGHVVFSKRRVKIQISQQTVLLGNFRNFAFLCYIFYSTQWFYKWTVKVLTTTLIESWSGPSLSTYAWRHICAWLGPIYLFQNTNPEGTWRLYNVVSTSMQRHDVASTLRRHCIDVMCLLGNNQIFRLKAERNTCIPYIAYNGIGSIWVVLSTWVTMSGFWFSLDVQFGS